MPPCCSATSRIASPAGVPPGSRATTSSCPCARNARSTAAMTVDFPLPSMPSNVMNTTQALGFRLENPHATVGLQARASGLQAVLLRQLVLHAAHVRGLRRKLHRLAVEQHLIDRFLGFAQRDLFRID